MRIALFTNTYPPSLNGVANCTHFYRLGLSELGHEVHVFAPAPEDDDPFADDPYVHRYPSARVPGEVDYRVALPSPFARGIPRTLGRLRFDLVHCQHPAWVGRWGQGWARRNDLPVVATAHTQYELFAGRLPLPRAWVESLIIRHVTAFFNACDIITTPVGWMRQKLVDSGVHTPIELVRNPVDLRGLLEPRRDETRRSLGLEDGETVIGYLGRVSPEKQLGMVIDAVERLSEKRPGVRLLVVGDGGAMDDVRRAARSRLGDRAILAGSVPHNKVAHYHAAMDVFATASRSETQPLAYTEAMYVGTPVVALATPGAADMIHDGDNGLLVLPERGAEGLAEAICRVIEDRQLAERLREGGRRFAESCHYPSVARRLEEVYELAIERHGTPV